MARAAAPARKRTRRKTSRKRLWLPTWWPNAQRRRRWGRFFSTAPLTVQALIVSVIVLSSWFILNGIYQVILKPTELFFPVSGALYKSPTETWSSYSRIFRKHSTPTITPEFLAALAQVEGSGNPIVRTYWRWSLSKDPFKLYRPASSAVGMYQITDGTFSEASRYCIHDHRVVEEGPWHDLQSCWFNSLYLRVIPSHAVELTSAYLDRHVAWTLTRAGISNATPTQKRDLAAVIHLCGAGAGERHARRGLRLTSAQRCGDHAARDYVAKVERMRRVFERMNSDKVIK